MHSSNTLRKDSFTPGSIINQITTNGWTWKGAGALLGLGGGFVSPVAGSLFTIVGWVTRHAWHALAVQRIGTGLFFAALPLLIFGAHCLDLLDREGKALHQ